MVDENPKKDTHNKKRRSPNKIREAQFKERARRALGELKKMNVMENQ